MSSPQDTNVPQYSKDFVLLDGKELDDDNKTEHPCMSSSSDPSPGKRNSEKTPDEVDKLREQVDALHTELPDLCWPSVNGWVKQYGFELVVLAIELLSRLVRHPKASDRPKTARYARKALDKWHTWLGERKPDQVPEAFRVEVLTYIRAEIEAQTRDCPKPHAPAASRRGSWT